MPSTHKFLLPRRSAGILSGDDWLAPSSRCRIGPEHRTARVHPPCELPHTLFDAQQYRCIPIYTCVHGCVRRRKHAVRVETPTAVSPMHPSMYCLENRPERNTCRGLDNEYHKHTADRQTDRQTGVFHPKARQDWAAPPGDLRAVWCDILYILLAACSRCTLRSEGRVDLHLPIPMMLLPGIPTVVISVVSSLSYWYIH